MTLQTEAYVPSEKGTFGTQPMAASTQVQPFVLDTWPAEQSLGKIAREAYEELHRPSSMHEPSESEAPQKTHVGCAAHVVHELMPRQVSRGHVSYAPT